jgi:hypothetical protein
MSACKRGVGTGQLILPRPYLNVPAKTKGSLCLARKTGVPSRRSPIATTNYQGVVARIVQESICDLQVEHFVDGLLNQKSIVIFDPAEQVSIVAILARVFP